MDGQLPGSPCREGEGKAGGKYSGQNPGPQMREARKADVHLKDIQKNKE